MTKGKGYLLPSGDATEDELEFCLVFYPARDEYRRALMGSLDYLATWIAWERDSEKRGQDAAASWKLANIQTWECCNMGFCNDLLTKLDELTDAVFSLYCCPDGPPVDLTDGDQYVDHYTENESNGVPDNIVSSGYASGDDDWDGFYNYKCMVSHVAIESLAQKLDKFEELADAATIGILSTGAIIIILGTILGVISGGTFIIVLSVLAGVAGVAALYQDLGDAAEGFFSDAADEVRAYAQDLACALYAGDGPDESYTNLLSKAAEVLTAPNAAVVGLMNMKPAIKALYSGRYDQTNVSQRLADLGYAVIDYSCACQDTPDGYHLAYPISVGAFQFSNCVDVDSGYQASTGLCRFEITSTGGNWRTYVPFNLPGGATMHGYVFRLIAANHPEDAVQFGPVPIPPYHVHPAQIEIGQYAAGYDDGEHSGAEWDNWVATYDNVLNIPNPSVTLNLQDYVSPQADGYNFTFLVWFLIPD